jgi:hypothetical protein
MEAPAHAPNVGGTLLVCWTNAALGPGDEATDHYEVFRWDHPQHELEQVVAAQARYQALVQAGATIVSLARVERSTDYP